MAENLAARWCGQAARRDDARVARRLDRQQVVDGVDRRDDGAWLDEFFHGRPQRCCGTQVTGMVDGMDLDQARKTLARAS